MSSANYVSKRPMLISEIQLLFKALGFTLEESRKDYPDFWGAIPGGYRAEIRRPDQEKYKDEHGVSRVYAITELSRKGALNHILDELLRDVWSTWEDKDKDTVPNWEKQGFHVGTSCANGNEKMIRKRQKQYEEEQVEKEQK